MNKRKFKIIFVRISFLMVPYCIKNEYKHEKKLLFIYFLYILIRNFQTNRWRFFLLNSS